MHKIPDINNVNDAQDIWHYILASQFIKRMVVRTSIEGEKTGNIQSYLHTEKILIEKDLVKICIFQTQFINCLKPQLSK